MTTEHQKIAAPLTTEGLSALVVALVKEAQAEEELLRSLGDAIECGDTEAVFRVAAKLTRRPASAERQYQKDEDQHHRKDNHDNENRESTNSRKPRKRRADERSE